jgi:hypothetical protein
MPFALWPFTDYPMYRRSHVEGELLHRYHVFALRVDGSETLLTLEGLGVRPWQFERQFVVPLMQPEALTSGQRRRLRHMVDLFQAKHGGIVRELRLENHPYVVMRGGLRPVPPHVIRAVDRTFWSEPPS